MFENHTLAKQISDHIAREIVSGNLKPGERLLEEMLKDQFGTSRAPIREALLVLEQRGVVERIARKGVFVKKYSKKEVFDFYDVVYEITNFSIRIAVEKGLLKFDELVFNVLLEKLRENQEKKNMEGHFKYVEEIHENLIAISDNITLIDLYSKLNLQWTTFRFLTLSHPSRLTETIEEYSEIVENIKLGNLEKIREILDIKKNRALKVLDGIITDNEIDYESRRKVYEN
ncbi:hypothetical protein UACE39S_01378 [Ureibacillus acetophenoni]